MVDPLTLSAVGWGISTAGWIISPNITRLLNKAFSHISSDEPEKLRHLETNILPRLALTLEAVEGSEHRSLFEQLVRELKSAFYEVEDILDDVEYCRLEKQLSISSKKSKNASDDGAGPSNQDVGCKSSWTMPGPLKSRLKEMLKKVEKLIDEAQKIIGLANLPSDHRPEVTAKYVQKPTAADPPRKVTGRDEDRQQIISMLRENPSSSGGKSFSVIGIHGIPGSGKTTLAQYVCEYEEKESYFDLVMWVHVSQNFRVDISGMIEQATKKPCPQFMGFTTLQKYLKEELRGKRFLLILDDVWYNKDLSQEELSPLEVGEAGSRILVTSRTLDALSALCAVRCVPMPELDENAFLELFMHYALEGAMIDDQDRGILEIIGADIAKKLKRSPLLARTVGGQLRIRPNVDFWRRVRDQKIIGLANLPSDHRPEVTAKYVQKPTAANPPRKVTGRDEDRQQIISMLRENPSSNGGKSFSVIGIHGIPGSGKTTLAQYVCEYEEKESYFDLVMWIHVSQNFRVETIFSEMIEQATREQCPQFRNLTALQKHLKEKLCGKRFLLVLDDVWHNKDLSQEELSPLEVGEAGSKILVTSRTSDALLALGAVSCIPIPDLDERAFLELFMHYALEGAMIDGQDRGIFETIGADIAQRLKRSPLLAGTVGGQLRIRPHVDFWRRVRDRDVLTDTVGALWWSYQHLDEQARRCFAYCSIFPRRHRLRRDNLVNFWVAEGFIKTTEIGEEMEDVARDYFDELVSTSFLQLQRETFSGEVYCTIHDLLHDLAEKVAGSDCFIIENGWTGEVPRDVRHLFVETCNRGLLAEKILKLENLRTLIIGSGTMNEEIEDEDLESMFTKLRKLRILSIPFERECSQLSVPASIGQLKHIRYLAIKMSHSLKLILPSTFTQLYHMQVLDFGSCSELVLYPGQDMMSNLINLRHILALLYLNLPNTYRLTSLQTLPIFRVRKEPGYELRQLRDLNKLRGRLEIEGLVNVGSKEEALEANLAGKKHLTDLTLGWGGNVRRCSADLEAEILEGLCPPMGLEELVIHGYKGSRYPDWMVGNKNGPKHLQQLVLIGCSPLGAIPDRNEFFLHLRGLSLTGCSWDALPDNMEHLTSLEKLWIFWCQNIRSLPRLPQSLEYLSISLCTEEFMRSCKTIGDPNWQKIEHVPNKDIDYEDLEENDCDDLNEDPEQEEAFDNYDEDCK